MAKILVIVLGLLIAYWLLKRYRKALSGRDDAKRVSGGEDMVRCALCGLHLPRSESLAADSKHFCCPEHERQHRADA